MIGLLALGLTVVMIFVLIKNALTGIQFTKEETLAGRIDVIVPLGPDHYFPLNAWQNECQELERFSGLIKIHFLVEGHHAFNHQLQEMTQKSSLFTLHHFATKPSGVQGNSWMIEQIRPHINAEVIIFNDPEVVPKASALICAFKQIKKSPDPLFIVPQVSRSQLFGELNHLLNPNLAFVSTFSFHRWRKNLSHPLLGISLGELAMAKETFEKLKFNNIESAPYKELMAREWDENGTNYRLAFGEKFLTRYFPESFNEQFNLSKKFWDGLWNTKASRAFWPYLVSLFLWSFPFIFFFTHFFWAFASIMLLMLYRFFTKIVFQESWVAAFAHPLSCLLHLAGLFTWLYEFKFKKAKH